MGDIKKVKEKFDQRNFPQQTRIFLEKGGQKEVARNAGSLVKDWWSMIIKPEIKMHANSKLASAHGGHKKRSGAQLLEKLESKKDEPKVLELEVPIHEPKTTNTGKRIYIRDSKGRFAKHEFHSAMSKMGDTTQDILSTMNPNLVQEPLKPIKETLLETPNPEGNGDILTPEKYQDPDLLEGPVPKGEALTPTPFGKPVPPPKPKKKSQELYSPPAEEFESDERPVPPPKPKKKSQELYSPPAEEFESFAGRKKAEISGKEAARRAALSERMKNRGTKREREAEEKFMKRMKK